MLVKKFPHFVRQQKVYYHVHNSALITQINPVRTLTACNFKTQFNIITFSPINFLIFLLHLGFSITILYAFFHLAYACCMIFPAHSPLFELSNIIL